MRRAYPEFGAGTVDGADVAAEPHVITAAPRPISRRGVESGAACGGRLIVMPTVVEPPPEPLGLTSTLARPFASLGTSTKLPPS